MPLLWWSLTLIVMMLGLAGTVVPLVPGTVLILAAAVIHRLALGEAHSVGWWTIGGLTFLMILSHVVDLVSGAIGAKWFGATRWGAIGGIIGAIAGLFYLPLGLFLGPL